MSDSPTTTLVLRSDVLSTVIEDGAVLFDLATNYFYALNETGWAIIQMYEAGATPAHVEAQCRAWGARPQDAEAIASFMAVVNRDKLVAPSEWPASDLQVAPRSTWSAPTIEKAPEPLQQIMKSAFDPTLPLAE